MESKESVDISICHPSKESTYNERIEVSEPQIYTQEQLEIGDGNDDDMYALFFPFLEY
jgi:hypothetical protein